MATKAASSCSLSGYSGYYGGCTLTIGADSSYPYIYVGSSQSGTYYLKASSGNTISIDADTTSTSKTIYIFRSDTNLGSSVSMPFSSGPLSYSVPRFAFQVYVGSSTPYVIADTKGSGTINVSDYGVSWDTGVLLGWSHSSTASSIDNADYGSLYWQDGPSLNGTTLYALLSASSSLTYYRGSSSSYSLSVSSIIYGTGSVSNGSIDEPTKTCVSDSSYSFVGWSSSRYSTSYDYSTLQEAVDSGCTTVYGVYEKAENTSNSTVYYYRGSSTKYSTTKTTTTEVAYYYGRGSHTGGNETNTYGTVRDTCISDSTYSFVGWATSSSDTSVYSTDAATVFDAGYSTIYGVFEKTGTSTTSTVYYYRGNSTKNSVTKTTTTGKSYYYGTGTQQVGETINSYGTVTTDCAVSGWTFIGFATDTSTQSSTSSAQDLFETGNTTIYGTYSKTESMTYYPENGDASGSASVTNYRYGTGSTTNNYPTQPTLSKEKYTLVGWATSSGATDYSTWNALWDNGTRTVYAIWSKNGNVYYGINGEWKIADVYYGIDGVWVPASAKCGLNDVWN